ncbi:necrosis inducing protein [Colletotrichum tamarilloi]|uniref:Necrosis inducing protein n=1 Tax=Colletotrichum tamarilloi TaxID=1209934 RepID=A0ABQ9RMS1_9PEZI|nr:necrosis inducing protein [Colletotrichum tamarilloi]KAK1507801.1 necrosis inducing protein [Colletotrichum tamarilloi]
MLSHPLLSLLHLLPLLGLATSSLLPRGKDIAFGDKWKNHNEIIALRPRADEDLLGDIELKFAPFLYSWHGCIPYPAVDVDGNHGRGLKPTGDAGGDCRDFKQSGQTYSRVGKSHDRWAVLYSYYLPKVQGKEEQHRHHWLTVVVWLAFDTCPDDARVFSRRGVSYSTSPGNFDTTRSNTLFTDDEYGLGTHPIVAYDAGQPIFPSSSGPDGALRPPLVGWQSLPGLVKEQFNGMQYEHTKVPFSDNNFQNFLDAAYSDVFYKDVPTGQECGSDDPPQSEIDPDFGEALPTSTAPVAEPTDDGLR